VREPILYDYSIIRVVPYVERQEFLNVGVIIFCKELDFLDTKIDFNLNRVQILDPEADLGLIRKQLKTVEVICNGNHQNEFFNNLSKSQRFHWLVAPASTIIQMSPVHNGMCSDPQRSMEELYRLFIM